MSWRVLNEMLSLASLDQNFCQELLADPLRTMRRYHFQLTQHEQQILSQIHANDLTTLSQQIIQQLTPEHME